MNYLTPEEEKFLKEIEARKFIREQRDKLRKVTPGEWGLSREKDGYKYISSTGWKDFCRVVVRFTGERTPDDAGIANSEFIANSKTVLEKALTLLEEVYGK